MRVTALVSITALALVACQPATFDGAPYGEPLTLETVTPVSEILASPDRFVGERVMVEGTIAEVCDRAGCWMDIQGESPDERIQVKVNDGEIVFPVAATGKRARVEGVVEKLEMTQAEAVEAARHRAEEQGEAFDASGITGPVTTYRIRGAGAVIAE